MYVVGVVAACSDEPQPGLPSKLDDIPSSGGVMSYRGREERMEFVATFRTVYHFRLLYRKPYLYPIYGSVPREQNLCIRIPVCLYLCSMASASRSWNPEKLQPITLF